MKGITHTKLKFVFFIKNKNKNKLFSRNILPTSFFLRVLHTISHQKWVEISFINNLLVTSS